MISRLFITRPILATVCSLIVMLAGAIAIPTLPIARYPELTPPSVSVAAFYNGANAQTVESAVTTPLEQVINGVEGMLYMTSSSTSSGFASINVTFDVGVDPDLAAVNVQNRVNQALGRMPADVRTNGISVTKNTTGFLGGIGVFSPDGRYDELFISNYVDLYVRDSLRRVPGVGDVIIFGERKFAMRLWLDPDKLAGRSLTASDVVAALREQNVQVAAGSVGGAPAADDQAYQLSVRAEGRLTEAAEFENVVVKAGRDGALVRVKDVGRVELGAENYTSQLRFAGVPASGIGITLLPSANALDTFQGVNEALDRLRPNFPPGLEARIAFDNVSVVRESIIEVLKTLGEAIVLVVLVLFLFLQNWRSTLIPAMTIPVSLIGTFAFMKLLGFSINTLTLFGIVLATGTVVDDAIVVIENIERHMREYGKSALRASIDGMAEVFSAVIVIGIVLVAVFVPVAFFPGTTGRMYQQFSITIAFAVVLSVFNAVTFTPALAALLLDKEKREHGLFFRFVNRVIDGGTRVYVTSVRWALRWELAMLVVFALGLWATYAVYRAVPASFVPDEDEGYLMAIIQAPSGASLEYTTNLAKQAEQIIMAQPEVLAVFSVVGFSFSGSAPNQGLMFARLDDFEKRRDPSQSLSAVVGRLSGALIGGIPGGMIFPVAPPSLQGVSAFGGFQFEVLDGSGGPIENLAAVTQQLIGKSQTSDRVGNLFSSFTANDPQLVVDIDRDRARSLGLPMSAVTDTLQVLLGSQYVNDFDFNNRAYRVYVQADKQFRGQPADLRQYYARASAGQMVPLDTVVKLSETTAPAVISHYNMARSAEISGAAKPGVSSGQAIEAMEQLAKETLPAGFTYSWSGLSLEEINAGSQAVYIFALSIILVYLVLAAQYESWVLPFIILLGVPLAVFGALGAQLMRGLANDVFCQVGLVMLIGLAAKNSILIVEFAEQLRQQGRSILDSAVEAARIRLRPILMTSLTFILGVLPLAFATGAGSAGRNSVGTTVVGGMIASTFLSVIFIPVLYVAIRTVFPGRAHRGREVVTAPAAVGVLILALGVGVPGAAFAQPASARRVEFDAAIAQALARNPGVAQAATAVAQAEAQLAQARAGTRPGVTAGLNNVTVDTERGFEGGVFQPQNQFAFTASAGMPLYAPTRWAGVNQARDQIDVAGRSVTDVRQRIAVAAAQSYLAVIAARRQVDVDVRALETARAHLDYATRRFEGGAGSRLDRLRAAQAVTVDETRLEASRLALLRAQEALGVVLAEPGPVDAGAEPAFETPGAVDEAAWMAARPDFQVQQSVRRAAERVLGDSRKEWLPTGSVSFDPTLITPSGLFQPSRTWRLTFVVTQPVFDGGQRRASEAQRRATLTASELGVTLIEIQARSEVRTAQASIASLERALASARTSAEQAAEVLKITTAAFEVGATTNIEVIDAQRSARDADTLAAFAEDAVRRARLELLVALGRFPA